VGALPTLYENNGGWLLFHVCLGPELRMEYRWGDAVGTGGGLFSLPLVAELNFLAAGD
jgi:hypothetical protein